MSDGDFKETLETIMD